MNAVERWEKLEQSGCYALLKRVAHVWHEPKGWKFGCDTADGSFELVVTYVYGDWKVHRKLYFTAIEVENSMKLDHPESLKVQKKIEEFYAEALGSLKGQMEASRVKGKDVRR
jgi:hypothetical protein